MESAHIGKIENVLYVEGLTTNLISVSQLTDEFEDVLFNSRRCLVFKYHGKTVMGGKRSTDNCYHVALDYDTDIPKNCLRVMSTDETF